MVNKIWITRVLLFLISSFLLLDSGAKVIAEWWWFDEVGYLSVFGQRLLTQSLLWLIAAGITALFLGGNWIIANRYKYPPETVENTAEKLPYFAPIPVKKPVALSFKPLIIFIISLSILLGLILVYYGQIFLKYWRPDLNLPLISPLIPEQFEVESIVNLLQQIPNSYGLIITSILIIIGTIIQPQLSQLLTTVFLSLGFGLVLSSHWGNILLSLHPTVFNQREDLFNHDLSLYIFILPIAHLLDFWLFGIFTTCLISCTLVYLLSGNSFSQGRFSGFSQPQQRHLHGLAGLLMLSLALKHLIDRYELLYSKQGVVFGASYTDVNVQSPVYLLLFFITIAIAIFLFGQAFFSVKALRPYIEISLRTLRLRRKKRLTRPRTKLFADSYSLRAILAWYITIVFAAGWLLPSIVQRLVVQPNEIAREIPYIERSIRFTRNAFGLENMTVETFAPQGELTYNDIQNNDLTIKNVRLWDERPLLKTNRQLQQIRPYYEFNEADIDRYTLLKEPQEQTANNRTEKQQVLITARELNYQSVPEEAQTWVNKHLVYTHGYGFTLSPVNRVGEGGLPEYFVKNIGASPQLNPESTLEVAPRVKDSIPIGNPRIYYGELTNTDVMTSTSVDELDYPLGDENVYNTYEGTGGIAIGSGWQRLIFANYLRNWQMIFTRNFQPDTKLLFRRNIIQRVKAIAPFLRYDSDPYLVVAKGDSKSFDPNKDPSDRNYLYWILDAYTTSSNYPYSDPEGGSFNYIRNSVKVVIDAYNGSVKFYYLDQLQDPIITSWQKVFPELFQPIEEMPPSLYTHIRYPLDLFRIQSERLLTYHMDDPRVFYNREDQWRVPTEIYGNEQLPVEPYYITMRLPQENSEEFILLQPFTPASRINLIAWLAARSDAQQYGKLLLYQFPKERLVFGPEQVEALINQKPEISEQISLWNRQGSRVIQGNLLVIPIEQSLLYVEPIYLEATENSLPTLARVIVSYENQIVMRPTLQEALQAVFQAEPIESPLIIPADNLPEIS
ncbi:MAG: UPF0182 family protein [Microcoleaceae cyanobacterium]